MDTLGPHPKRFGKTYYLYGLCLVAWGVPECGVVYLVGEQFAVGVLVALLVVPEVCGVYLVV
jgi:hypothetical protein